MLARAALMTIAIGASACAAHHSDMPPASDASQFVVERAGAGSRVWRPDLCARVDLRPEFKAINETSLVSFLRSQQLDARVERQPVEPNKPELVFVFVSGAGVTSPVALRVAIMPTADDAGRALEDALEQRGDGAWGLHRANLAVLGPVGSLADDTAFVGRTRLGCWGTFTVADSGDRFVVPGGYAEP